MRGRVAADSCLLLQRFQEALAKGRTVDTEDERHQYFGLSLRELVREFKWQTLVLFKCLLLQPKVSEEMADSLEMSN